MAKKKTEDKELKPKATPKKEAAKEVKKIEVPKTKWVSIILKGEDKIRKAGYDNACLLVSKGKAKLA